MAGIKRRADRGQTCFIMIASDGLCLNREDCHFVQGLTTNLAWLTRKVSLPLRIYIGMKIENLVQEIR